MSALEPTWGPVASRRPPGWQPARPRATIRVPNRGAPPIFIGTPLAEILAALLAYLIGAIPFGWLTVRFLKGVDLRTIGSGNIGATNAARLWPGTRSILVFAVVFILDFGKGFVACSFAHQLGHFLGAEIPGQTLGMICGAAAILGHVFTPYLHFKGGKGVATALGVVTALAPISSIAAVGTWGLLVVVTRYMSVGSIGAMVAIPIVYFLSNGADTFRSRLAVFLFFVALMGIVIWRHRENILRILKGQERKVGADDQI